MNRTLHHKAFQGSLTVLLLCVASFACIDKKETSTAAAGVIPDTMIRSTDTSLSMANGIMLYKGNPYSGIVSGRDTASGDSIVTRYLNGLQEGWQETYFANGNKATQRYYSKGEKDSVHTGWWPNGTQRFEYHFIMGDYNGTFAEWYADGKPAKRILYDQGKELEGKGWRENGKIYMSYVMKDGRRYGLVNAQLCYSLKNERGEYVK